MGTLGTCTDCKSRLHAIFNMQTPVKLHHNWYFDLQLSVCWLRSICRNRRLRLPHKLVHSDEMSNSVLIVVSQNTRCVGVVRGSAAQDPERATIAISTCAFVKIPDVRNRHLQLVLLPPFQLQNTLSKFPEEMGTTGWYEWSCPLKYKILFTNGVTVIAQQPGNIMSYRQKRFHEHSWKTSSILLKGRNNLITHKGILKLCAHWRGRGVMEKLTK